MDKHLTPIESKLQDLLHVKDFEALNKKETEFVLENMSKSDYMLERAVISNASSIFEDEEEVAVPVFVPITNSTSGLKTSIPLYQSLLLVAATVVIMFMILPIKSNTTIEGTNTEYIVKTDTIEIEKEIIKYDTVFQTIEKPIYIEKDVYVESKPCIDPIQEEPRLLNSNPSINLPDLTQTSVSNKGTSMKNDNVSSLIVEF